MSAKNSTNRLFLSGVLFGVFAAFAAFPFVARAADMGCGRDTDRNGTVDNLCPGSDQDFDGYTSATGDCDDQDWEIFPGSATTKGCGAGMYRVCRADGAGYTACVSSSATPYCPSGIYTTSNGKSATACYYFDASNGSDTTGNGSWASPWKSPNKISFNNTSKYTAKPGDAFIFKAGTYTEMARADADNDRVIFFATKGTVSSPTWIVGYPGTKPIFRGSIDLYDVEYSILRNIEIIQGNMEGQGIIGRGDCDSLDIAGFYIHGKRGQRENNQACVAISQGGTSNYVHHNYVADCNDPADQYQPNGADLYMGRQDSDSRVEYNSIMNSPGGSQYCIYEKHINYGSNGTIKGNYCTNAEVFLESSGGYNRTVQNNLATSCSTGIVFVNSAGPTHFGGTMIENNTFICEQAITTAPCHSHNRDDSTTGIVNEECGSDEPAWAVSTFRYNINRSTASTYRAQSHGEYKSDATYALWHGAGKWSSHHNGYYSPASSILRMRVFAWNNGCTTACCGNGKLGAEFAGLSEIQSNGYEANSVQEDPQFDARGIAVNPKMAGWGYMSASQGPVEPVQPASGLTGTLNN